MKRIHAPSKQYTSPSAKAICTIQEQKCRAEWFRSLVDIDNETTAHGNRTNDSEDYLSVRIQR